MVGLDRTDRFLWGGAFLLLGVFLGSMYFCTDGTLSLPLDDSYIYFQYARQVAEGHFLRYNTGDSPTTGATSLLYLALLVPGCWLGFYGSGMVVYALVLGFVSLLASLWLMRRLGALLGDGTSGTAAALLLLLCGPLLWGYFSGMEIGLFACLILLVIYQFSRESASGRFRYTVWAAAALTLARPEGVLLACFVTVTMVRQGGSRQRWSTLVFYGMPLIVFLAQMGLYALLTGSFGTSGVASKWRFSAPHVSILHVLRLMLFDFLDILKGVLGGSLGEQTSVNLFAYDGNSRRAFFGPFFLLFFALGLTPGLADECRTRRLGVYSLAGVLFFSGILASCSIEEADAHFNRYQQPFLPLFLLMGTVGIFRVGTWIGEKSRSLGLGLVGFYAFFGLCSTAFFAVAYGETCSDISRMQLPMARYIDRHLPMSARVAINDAGALKYFGNRYIVDLVGLVSPGFSRAWRHGSGSLYERLEAMPPGARPEFFAIFPNWFRFEEIGLLRPLHGIRLFNPSIVDAEKVLYRANWRLANSGNVVQSDSLKQALAGWTVVDRVDVADLENEGAHGYRSRVWQPGQQEANLLLRQACEGDATTEVVDGGRTVTGDERMHVRLWTGRPARMVMRSVTGIREHFQVYCNGLQVGEVRRAGGSGRVWTEFVAAEIPAHLTGDVWVETRAMHEGGAVAPIVSFHYWFYQPGE